MGHQRPPFVDRASRCLVGLLAALTAIPLAAQTPSMSSDAPGDLRTFTLPKPALPQHQRIETPAVPPVELPAPNERLRTMFGFGYVQGADWGSEIFATGTVRGLQVQLNSLVTRGRDGFIFDRGSFSLFDPDEQWHVEVGDVFSHLRGAGFGGRFSWAAAAGRRPAIAVYTAYTPRPGLPGRGTAISYRDQIRVRGQTALDAEVATDRSYLLRSRLSKSRMDLEAFYRSTRVPFQTRDASLSGGVRLWEGIALNGGLFRSVLPDDRSDWRTVALRLPVARFLDVTFERAFSRASGTSSTTSAAMASVVAGDLRLFHRVQHGDYGFMRGNLSGTIEQQQTRSMTSYSPHSRMNLTLQLATQHDDAGRVQHWEELQVTMKLTAKSTLRTVTSVPDIRNAERFQAYFRQELPYRLSLQADYGRLSAYQSVARELDRSRFKLMIFKTVDIATPARGAAVAGRVLDNVGRGVAGSRVKLGPYTTDTNSAGEYRFVHVPPGEYELSLDRQLLPADFAWDGRLEHLALTSSRAVARDLRVTPLNAVHGRVYVDRNRNERADADEGLAGVAVRLGDRLTATDRDGNYSVYNLWPGVYVVTLGTLPAEFEAPTVEKTVTLRDGAPVTGADFRVFPKTKPIVWERLTK